MSRALLVLLYTLALPARADGLRAEAAPAVQEAQEEVLEDIPLQARCDGALASLESRSAPLGEPWDAEAERLVALEASCEEALRVGQTH